MPNPPDARERADNARFTSSCAARGNALIMLRLTTQAIADGRDRMAGALIFAVEAEPVEVGQPSRDQIIDISLVLLDSWHGDVTQTEARAGTRIPAWNSRARAAARDIIGLACKNRAVHSLEMLHRKHSGPAILEGGVLALTGSLRAWAAHENRTVRDLGVTVFADKPNS